MCANVLVCLSENMSRVESEMCVRARTRGRARGRERVGVRARACARACGCGCVVVLLLSSSSLLLAWLRLQELRKLSEGLARRATFRNKASCQAADVAKSPSAVAFSFAQEPWGHRFPNSEPLMSCQTYGEGLWVTNFNLTRFRCSTIKCFRNI